MAPTTISAERPDYVAATKDNDTKKKNEIKKKLAMIEIFEWMTRIIRWNV